MATVLENVGRKSLTQFDYVGSLNIQLWATLRAMGSALPFVGNRYRWQASVRQMLQIGVDALPMVSLMAIDSLRVMALEPVEFILAPKYLAALITVPCLSIASNVCGILAGGLFMFFSTHLSPLLYLRYVFTSIQLRDVITGLIKSVAFATIIAHVGCLEGFRVRGGPDSVGRSTTSAVVKSTFLVIVADAVFTAIFYFTGKP